MINQEPIDIYTAAHFTGGAICARLNFPPFSAALIGVGWELLERPLKVAYPSLFPAPTQDTIENSAVDFLAFMAGFYIADR